MILRTILNDLDNYSQLAKHRGGLCRQVGDADEDSDVDDPIPTAGGIGRITHPVVDPLWHGSCLTGGG